MPIAELDHYFIWSKDLEASRKFYCDILGLQVMPRPPVQLPGYWFGTGGRVQVHTGQAGWSGSGEDGDGSTTPANDEGAVNVDHIAFVASNPEDFHKHLKSSAVTFRVRYIDFMNLVQIDLPDPDGILIELNFYHVETEPAWIGENAS
jgi:catechol 2,3-dioxygenase-like lactoylglutathione lyase family enzyme